MGWIGVDLDGTLAHYNGWANGQIGEPVPAMIERVKMWLEEDRDVRIFTARVAVSGGYSLESHKFADVQFADEQRELIGEWCLKHIGRVLPVTATKDFSCIEIYDDRAWRVEMNTGRVIGEGGK